MSSQLQNKKGLTVKDLIVMGVFAALLTVCSMIGGVFFAITPTLTFYFSIGAALLSGPVVSAVVGKSTQKGRTFCYWNNHFSFEPCVRNALGNVSWWLYCVCSC